MKKNIIPLHTPWYAHLNLPRELAYHLFGDDHTPSHRMGIGALVMCSGVALVYASTGWTVFGWNIHFACDVVGYAIHGLGALPWLEQFAETVS